MREWMSLMIKELVRPDVGLFSKTDSDQISYTINPKSSDSVATLDMYEFAGKVVGKAIFERITLDIHFDDCFLKSLAGRDLVLDDLRSLDTPVNNKKNSSNNLFNYQAIQLSSVLEAEHYWRI